MCLLCKTQEKERAIAVNDFVYHGGSGYGAACRAGK